MSGNRTFEDLPAVRTRVPLLIGLMGPSGGGKTYSALRLATGIQSVSGGEIFVIDTEARRALHYAEQFKFRHLAFGAPFSPLDYLAAIEHCVAKGAGVVVIDSMSHEHEGLGGVLEWHEAETKRLAALWRVSEEKAKMGAWGPPKRARRKLINGILQMPINVISCFRAKKKLKIVRGKDPQQMGFMPIAGEEFVFEQTVNALLLPGAGGVPAWAPEETGEREMVKIPGWSRAMFREGAPLDEDAGAKLALWAAGTVPRTVADILTACETCRDPAGLGALKADSRTAWKGASKSDRAALTAALEAAAERVALATEDAADTTPDEEQVAGLAEDES